MFNFFSSNFDFVFFIRFSVELLACLITAWDCTAHGHMLIGYQDYDDITGVAKLAESVYLHSYGGLLLFRMFLWSIPMVLCILSSVFLLGVGKSLKYIFQLIFGLVRPVILRPKYILNSLVANRYYSFL